jgi:hypothetical protein
MRRRKSVAQLRVGFARFPQAVGWSDILIQHQEFQEKLDEEAANTTQRFLME